MRAFAAFLLQVGAPPARRLEALSAELLKARPRWACVDKCGACCYLKPEEREDLPSWLGPEELETYKAMVSDDGWCVNYDKDRRLCQIYDTRPDFCRVEPQTFRRMYGVDEADLDIFCTACCRDHIRDVYGDTSDEIRRFNGAVKDLRRTTAAAQKRQQADDVPAGTDERDVAYWIKRWTW
mmetsp:Transcript_426/g.1554  ORF Transcript_426/g.1554 Transcript_426/m.1554 type:complete len:181 (+) Transcript_426:1529-2071(+)